MKNTQPHIKSEGRTFPSKEKVPSLGVGIRLISSRSRKKSSVDRMNQGIPSDAIATPNFFLSFNRSNFHRSC